MPTPTTRRPRTACRGTPLAVVAALVVAASTAPAQPPPGPVMRPTVSPYLNLLQGNAPPVANYFGVVRPLQEVRRQNAQLTNQLGTLQGQLAQPGVQPDLPETGHVAGFMTAGGYFKNLNAGLPARGGLTPAPTTGAPPAAGGTRSPARR